MSRDSVLVRPEVLAEDYLPSFIHERERHIKYLMSALYPVVRGRKPTNVWTYGKTGSGKTCVCRFVLHKLRERWGEGVKGAYLNCAHHPSLYSILDAIMREFKLLGGEAPSTSLKLDRFLNFVRQKPFLIILDEIDFVAPKERNNILYNLARTGTVGIISISRTDETYYKLDERVRSRLSARTLQFEEYTAEQVLTILAERARQALRGGSWDEQILTLIAQLSEGDVRAAIEMLKSAAEYAEAEGDRIALEHVHRGARDIKALQRDFLLKRLTEHHRILYRIIEGKPRVLSGGLWTAYVETCRTTGQQPVARRTFSSYLQALENVGLIVSEKAVVKGKVRSFNVPN